ncbi:MAG: AAA family ATPase [Tepidanaerobacteraceae bacterium]|nr:AAA family ATPase [Bacteroidales bacterium]MDD4569513.1 AAA family ATPase [Tepidanaerobacteraceae bacterium]
MRITKIIIKNYRSFDSTGQQILFPTQHAALVGKNNTGKTNIFNALNLVLGNKNPAYINFEEDDYFDSSQPIEIRVVISDISVGDKTRLFSLPGLTKPMQGALNGKINDGTADISFLLRKNYDAPVETIEEESGDVQDTFEIKLWGFNVFRKKEDIRRLIMKIMVVPAVRNYKDELTASKWTSYGQLMKDVLENSLQYPSIKADLVSLNTKIQEVFMTEKTKLLEGARVVSYVDDISFQLTKDNNPSELLRNLEVFIKEGARNFNIEYVGTGTQSAIIIGMFELVLKNKSSNNKFFCIDEPEAFIHPHGIRYLGSLIKNVSSDQNTQVLISTHSLSLVANFEPIEIIRVDKIDGKTIIKQDVSLTAAHFKRFIHQDNAEIFFSDRVVFVEGATEKHLFGNLDKITKLQPADQDSIDCNFDRLNLGIIRLDSVDSIVNYIKIARAFSVKYAAVLDKDFITDPSKQNKCRELCQEVGITFQTTDLNQLINDFKTKQIIINNKGEIEDIFSDQEVANISGKTLTYVQSTKAAHINKTSRAFKQIFGAGKAEYAIVIADYYKANLVAHPLEDVIRKIYNDDIININF